MIGSWLGNGTITTPAVPRTPWASGGRRQKRGQPDIPSASHQPGQPLALYNLANALGVLGRLDEALIACHRALEIDPTSADAHTALGAVLQTMGRFDEVRTAYEQAIAVKPSFPAPYKNLAHGRRVTPDDGLIERIQGVLAKDTLPDRDRSVFNFALENASTTSRITTRRSVTMRSPTSFRARAEASTLPP